LHTDIYVHGLKTAIAEDYGRLAEKMDFDEKIFINELTENKFKQMAMQDFQEAGALGVDSYPAVLISIDGVVRELARGYMKWNDLERLINAELLK
jgi:protein-disulfide isomerase-like protein with CxxC motif